MKKLILTTFDWVPELPRGYVRDIRVRWALEEAGLPYRVEGVPFSNRSANHFAHQPFGQVPWLTDGDLSIFESGAILIYLAEKSEVLMSIDTKERFEVIQWLFAALNSIEVAVMPYTLYKFYSDEEQTVGKKALDSFMSARLGHMEQVLSFRFWMTDTFSVADIVMSDVLRLVNHLGGLTDYPACSAYVDRATSRPAFKKAYDDQIMFFSSADL